MGFDGFDETPLVFFVREVAYFSDFFPVYVIECVSGQKFGFVCPNDVEFRAPHPDTVCQISSESTFPVFHTGSDFRLPFIALDALEPICDALLVMLR